MAVDDKKSTLVNYAAYKDPTTNKSRVGHLDLETQEITPLSYISGTPLTNLYEVIEIGEANIIPSGQPIKLTDIKLLPPISGRDILAVGKNYVEHAKEFNSSGYDSSDKVDQPTHPVIFTKRATSIIAHGDEILPHVCFTESPDYEGEIGVIIGKPGFRIDEADAMDHVWGFTIINDMTARERQRDHKQFYIGKSPDTFCPMGPIAVPKEHLPSDLKITTHVNGEKRQEASLKDLIFSIPVLVRTLSEAQTLQLGDVLATGTPYGVGFGFRPMKFLRPGDEINISVTGLGSLINRVAAYDSINPVTAQVLSTSYVPVSNNSSAISNSTVPGASSGLSTINGKPLFYQQLGQSSTSSKSSIVFVHGLGGTSSYFDPLVSRLSTTHSLHLYDLEGQGLSPTSALSKLSIDSFTSDLATICQNASTNSSSSPITLIAHSMGCLVALALTIQQPTLISRLILMGPPQLSSIPPSRSDTLHEQAALARSHGMPSVADRVINNTISTHSRSTNPLSATALRLSLLSQDPEGYAKACTALANWSDSTSTHTPDVSQIHCPTLLLTGSKDPLSPPAVCEGEYASRMQKDNGSSVKVLENVGHWHLFEDTTGVIEAVVDFLR